MKFAGKAEHIVKELNDGVMIDNKKIHHVISIEKVENNVVILKFIAKEVSLQLP